MQFLLQLLAANQEFEKFASENYIKHSYDKLQKGEIIWIRI
jgi:hypothetical protein